MNFPRASPLATPPDTRYVPPALKSVDPMRRGGREVECTALEMRHTCKGIVGSNPTLSATFKLRTCHEAPVRGFFLFISKEFGGWVRPAETTAAADIGL